MIGAIVTRLSAIEDLAGMSILCSDKTGTLTLNKMVIQEEAPVYYQYHNTTHHTAAGVANPPNSPSRSTFFAASLFGHSNSNTSASTNGSASSILYNTFPKYNTNGNLISSSPTHHHSSNTTTAVTGSYDNKCSLLQLGAMASKWKEPPKDALDTMILNAADLQGLDRYEQLDHMPFDPSIKRTESTVRDKQTHTVFKTTKGSDTSNK